MAAPKRKARPSATVARLAIQRLAKKHHVSVLIGFLADELVEDQFDAQDEDDESLERTLKKGERILTRAEDQLRKIGL